MMTARDAGLAALRSGDLGAAVRSLELATQQTPADPAAWSGLGIALCRAGRVVEGISALENAVRLAPTQASLHYNMGCGFEAGGRRADASRAYRRAAELDPHHTGAAAAVRRLSGTGSSPVAARAVSPPPHPGSLGDFSIQPAPTGGGPAPGPQVTQPGFDWNRVPSHAAVTSAPPPCAYSPVPPRRPSNTNAVWIILAVIGSGCALFAIFFVVVVVAALSSAPAASTTYQQTASPPPAFNRVSPPTIPAPQVEIPSAPQVRIPQPQIVIPPTPRVEIPDPPQVQMPSPPHIVIPQPPRVEIPPAPSFRSPTFRPPGIQPPFGRENGPPFGPGFGPRFGPGAPPATGEPAAPGNTPAEESAPEDSTL